MNDEWVSLGSGLLSISVQTNEEAMVRGQHVPITLTSQLHVPTALVTELQLGLS